MWSLDPRDDSGLSPSPAIHDDNPGVPVSSPETMVQLSSDSNAFLTALATQERRVLELREELQKAEGELRRLKLQWATHEASRKKDELRHVEPMRPLVSPTRLRDLRRDSEVNEYTNQQAKPGIGKRKWAPRKVFSGSRHTRTLSLLSPPLSQIDSNPSEKQLSETQDPPKSLKNNKKMGRLPDLKEASPIVIKQPTFARQNTGGFPTEDLVNTGKQLVGDLRDGLWTFLEDIRQAAAGENAVSNERLKRIALQSKERQALKHKASFNSHATSRRHAAGTIRSPRASKIVDPANRSLTPSPTQIRILKPSTSRGESLNKASQSKEQIKKTSFQPVKNTSGNDESQWLEGEDWENWDSPRSSSTSQDPSIHNQTPSRRRSSLPKLKSSSLLTNAFGGRKDSVDPDTGELPWPSVVLLPTNPLVVTASDMMSGWKTLESNATCTGSIASDREVEPIAKSKKAD